MAFRDVDSPLPVGSPRDGRTGGAVFARICKFGRKYGLSIREEQILRELVLGTHPKAIADAVGCRYATVRTHLRRVQRMLECQTTRDILVRFIAEM